MEADKILWKGTPSQKSHFIEYAVCALLFWLVVPIFYALYLYLKTKTTEYTISTERLSIRTGILSKTTDDLELYRVRDYQLDEPLVLRLFGLVTITLTTSDRSHPTVYLTGLVNARKVMSGVRKIVEHNRYKKGVREVDVGGE